jgi:hypothetical protein
MFQEPQMIALPILNSIDVFFYNIMDSRIAFLYFNETQLFMMIHLLRFSFPNCLI